MPRMGLLVFKYSDVGRAPPSNFGCAHSRFLPLLLMYPLTLNHHPPRHAQNVKKHPRILFLPCSPGLYNTADRNKPQRTSCFSFHFPFSKLSLVFSCDNNGGVFFIIHGEIWCRERRNPWSNANTVGPRGRFEAPRSPLKDPPLLHLFSLFSISIAQKEGKSQISISLSPSMCLFFDFEMFDLFLFGFVWILELLMPSFLKLGF